MDFHIKQNDTKTALKVVLKNDDTPVDLTGAIVMFKMGTVHETLISKNASIIDAKNGLVWVIFDVGDLANEGNYRAELKVTYSDNRVETFPNDDFIRIHVLAGL